MIVALSMLSKFDVLAFSPKQMLFSAFRRKGKRYVDFASSSIALLYSYHLKQNFFFDTYNLNRSFQTGFRVLGLNVVVWMNFAGSEGISESATLASLSPFEFWQENGKNDFVSFL